MIDIIAALALGIIAGIVTGMIPGVAIWTIVLVMFLFLNLLDPVQMIIIWLGALIGSQFFSSVAALLFRLPAETSNIIYLQHVEALTPAERLDLIKTNAIGGFTATLVATAFSALIFYFASDIFVTLSKNNIKIALYSMLFAAISLTNKHAVRTALLFILGISLAYKSSFYLPSWVYIINSHVSYYITPTMLVSATIIVPLIIFKNSSNTSAMMLPDRATSYIINLKTYFRTIIKSSIIGSLVGLIPGQSATLGALTAYNATSIDNKHKIVAAETADNSAVIASVIPLLTFGIPITLSAILLVSALQAKGYDFFWAIQQPLLVFSSHHAAIFLVSILYACIFLVLSIRFLHFYKTIFNYFIKHLYYVYIVVLLLIVNVDRDIWSIQYFLFFVAFALLGVALHKTKLPVYPLVIGYVLGDDIAWTITTFILLT